jgi:hypothetical protein
VNLPGFLRSVLAIIGGLGWGLVAAGCAMVRPPTVTALPAARGARLVIENLTDYEWRIAVAATAGTETLASRVSARSSAEINLAGGDYVIEQTVVAENAGTELTRRLPAQLAPGQTYRWRLVTLLSDPAGEAGRDHR